MIIRLRGIIRKMAHGISAEDYYGMMAENKALFRRIKFLESKVKLLEDKLYKKRHMSIKYRDLKKY